MDRDEKERVAFLLDRLLQAGVPRELIDAIEKWLKEEA